MSKEPLSFEADSSPIEYQLEVFNDPKHLIQAIQNNQPVNNKRTKSITEIGNRNKHLFIVGPWGSGKSSLLTFWLNQTENQGNFGQKINLSELANKGIDEFKELIEKQLISSNARLGTNNLICFDDLERLSSELIVDFLTILPDFANSYPKTRILITLSNEILIEHIRRLVDFNGFEWVRMPVNEQIPLQKKAPQKKQSKKAKKDESQPQPLKPGDQGEPVSNLQHQLKNAGYREVVEDGIFGEITQQAVTHFQGTQKLVDDGIVGPETLEKLKEIKDGAIGEDGSYPAYYWWFNFKSNLSSILIEKGYSFNTHIKRDDFSSDHKRNEFFAKIKNDDLGIAFYKTPEELASFLLQFKIVKTIPEDQSMILNITVVDLLKKPVRYDEIRNHEIIQQSELVKTGNTDSIYPLNEGAFRAILELADSSDLIPEERVAPSDNSPLHEIATKAHSDIWAEKDLLGYDIFASAIATLIEGDIKVKEDGEVKKRKASKPPLNIAIIAPWGQGKTTLMKFVEKNFDDRINKPDHAHYQAKPRRLLRWLNSKDLVFNKLDYPTVWFNPWKYQSSNQIWAGMGHAIITQLVQKLSPLDQEMFWFHLQMKRIDKSAVRKDIYTNLFEKWLPNGFIWLVSILAGVLAFFYKSQELQAGAIAIAVVLPVLSVIKGVQSNLKFLNSSLEGKYAAYVKAPDYESHLGLYHQINKDLNKVFNTLINKPAIVFIDDLDRCSPNVVAEVVEAINLMMNNPGIGKHCYFVIGMDAQMVAASLDVAYKNLQGKFTDQERRFGSVGWYFLDKFIQLPFFIPIMNETKKEHFLDNLFGNEGSAEKKKNIPNANAPETELEREKETKELKDDIKEYFETDNTFRKEEIINKQKDNPEFDKEFVQQRIVNYAMDSDDIKTQIKAFGRYINSDPRGLKRFMNLIRFYNSHQQLKKVKHKDDAEHPVATSRALAKWLTINLRWPQLVRWVQWENESHLLHSRKPKEKAKAIDDLIKNVEIKFNDKKLVINNADFDKWKSMLDGKNLPDKHLEWLWDKELLALLAENREEESRLEHALECNVW